MAKKIDKTNLQDTVTKTFNEAKEAVLDANETVYKTTEGVVDFSLKRGEEWQSVTQKAIQGGLKLAASQQDLVFDTLEVFKKQIVGGGKRFSKLFSKN